MFLSAIRRSFWRSKLERPGKRPKRHDNSWSSCGRAVVRGLVRSCGRAVVRSCGRAVVRSCGRVRASVSEGSCESARVVTITTRSAVEKHRTRLPPAISTKAARHDHGNAATARTCGAVSAGMIPPFLRRLLRRFCSRKFKHRLQTRFISDRNPAFMPPMLRTAEPFQQTGASCACAYETAAKSKPRFMFTPTWGFHSKPENRRIQNSFFLGNEFFGLIPPRRLCGPNGLVGPRRSCA